jgi:2-polyprenyl-3-methyl-5-hydroxy-6-metoxy-1,4-benzoquinol methylase
MPTKPLNQEQIRRRFHDNLDRGQPPAVQTVSQLLSSTTSLSSYQQVPSTFIQRVRRKIVVDYLPRINLTSHRRLRRANDLIEALQRDLSLVIAERDEAAQLLRAVAADRDRLIAVAADRDQLADELQQAQQAVEKQVAQLAGAENLKTQVEVQQTTNAALTAQVDVMRKEIEETRRIAAALEAVLNEVKGERDWLRGRVEVPESTVELPMTISAEAPVPNEEAVRKYLATADRSSETAEESTFYFTLETSLRGSQEEISRRQSEYVPHLPFTHPNLPVADLGCGRGEFMRLLASRNILTVGIDLSQSNVDEARRHGLDVSLQDAVSFLEARAPGSLAGVTAFQVIEHVPHHYLRTMIELAFQKLAPGGFIFLETVNPYCLETFRTYYLDPTHQNPIPPDLLNLMLTFYGFEEKRIFFQSPIEPAIPASQTAAMNLKYQGYAILALKPLSKD